MRSYFFSSLHHRQRGGSPRWRSMMMDDYEPIPDCRPAENNNLLLEDQDENIQNDTLYHDHPNLQNNHTPWKLLQKKKLGMLATTGLLLLLSMVLMAAVVVGTSYSPMQLLYQSPLQRAAAITAAADHQTIPTLLSIRQAEQESSDAAHVNALQNKLYETWKQHLANHDPTTRRNLQQQQSSLVWLDRTQMTVRGSLTVSFAMAPTTTTTTDTRDEIPLHYLHNDDVLVLQCVVRFVSENDDATDDSKQDTTTADTADGPAGTTTTAPRVLEVATMAQVQATANAAAPAASFVSKEEEDDSNKNDNSSTTRTVAWRFDSFPVVRHEACQFVVYRQVVLGNDNTDDNTAPIQVVDATDWIRIHHAHSRPTNIHWAVGAASDPTHLTAQFTTGDEHGTPVVQYWPTPTPATTTSTARLPQQQQANDNTLVQQHHLFPHHHSSSTAATKVTGTSTTYQATDMCHAPANLTDEPGKFVAPGRLHTVRLTELQPDTEYSYQVGLAGGQGIVWSDTYTIRSPPAIGVTTYIDDNNRTAIEPFSYIVYGDQGCPSNGWGVGSLWTTALATREIVGPKERQRQSFRGSNDNNVNDNHVMIRAVHHLGDLSYAVGAAHIWDEWFAMIQPFATAVPLMVAVGNHEYDYEENYATTAPLDISGETSNFQPIWGNFHNDSGGECGVPVAKRFAMPQTNQSNGVFWYSYDMGPVHTTVISSEHDISPGSRQYEWLQEDLLAVNRTKTPWLVVESHRPMYQGEALWDNNAVGIAMRFEFEDLLVDYGVDLFLAGHYHSYFRTCDGLYRSRCHNGGPMHVTVGTAGGHLEYAGLYWNWWSAKHIRGTYGYGRVTVMNATALHFQFVKAGDENDTTAGDVLDDVWVYRDR